MEIFKLKNWPDFTYKITDIFDGLSQIQYQQGKLEGILSTLNKGSLENINLAITTTDLFNNFKIEGEDLDLNSLKVSFAKKMDVKIETGFRNKHKDYSKFVELYLDATKEHSDLTTKRLFNWHSLMFDASNNPYKLEIGKWRTEEMQIVSGAMGMEKVHFTAVDSKKVEQEMQTFLKWVNSNNEKNPIIKSSIAHLWFETIHPFDDGNGRIGRLISDYILSKSNYKKFQYISISKSIMDNRKEYYAQLNSASHGNMDITSWIKWYSSVVNQAYDKSNTLLQGTILKQKFWNDNQAVVFNERQKKVVNKLLDGFDGFLTTKKMSRINKCSHDTALRDIKDLMKKEILIQKEKGGRSTAYDLKINHPKVGVQLNRS